MKQNYLKKLMTALLLLCCTVAGAADFEVDGIYYDILSSEDKTVEVTRGSNKYSGAVTIPASVTYNSITYSVTSIGDYAFASCSGLTSINIPAGVTSIGKWAFYSCSGLRSIVVGDGNSVYDSRGNCNAIIETASNTLILGCKKTIIPSSVTSIGNYVFSNCTGLRSIVIPASVTSIGERAFYYCTGLRSIVIPASVTSIGESAFQSCTGLRSIVIPASVTSIGESAFQSCTGLTSIVVDEENTAYDSRNNCNAIIETASNTLILGCKKTIIPAGVTSIGKNAFYGCTGLTSITSHIVAEDLFTPGNYAFNRIDKDACTLYVPAGAKSTYAATDGWKEFKNIVEMSSDGSDATAIESVETKCAAPAVYYDLSGRRVENPAKGIYIVNGRKVFIK